MSSLGHTPTKLGRYELVTQIGHGGMAEVQLALQRGPAGFEKLVVIKLVHKNLATEKTFVDMLLDEARVAALVKHPNVVDIYDLGEVDGRYFIAMEYLEGEPLLGLLRAGRDGKRLDALSTARLISDTAEGLDAAHELQSIGGDPIELVHHDVSLGNIMILYNGQVKLVDFGVAKATQTAGPQMKVHGKFGYMAPEKLKGRGSDRRGDIWSLGVVLWEALTLRRLFRGSNEQDTMRMVLEHPIQKPSTVNATGTDRDTVPELDEIVMRALERDPDRRYSRAKDLARDIEEVLRVKGYGGRNDHIAKYMQSTFQAHIVARKKLLQEVTSKGAASPDVLEAAFDEAILDTGGAAGRSGKSRAPRMSGEFSIAFRGEVNAPRPKPSSREMLAESSDVMDIIDRRRSTDEMMAEGTPHSGVTELPKRVSKQMFAEATPVQDPEDYDRGKYPRGDTAFERASTSPIADAYVIAPKPERKARRAENDADAAVLAMVASLEPAVDETDEMLREQPTQPASASARAESIGSILQNAVEIKLDSVTKQELGLLRSETLGRSVSSVLERWDEKAVQPATIPDEEEPSRKSQRMAVPHVTSRRLEVVKKPPTQTFSVENPPPGVFLEEAQRSRVPLLILVGILLVAAALVAFVVL